MFASECSDAYTQMPLKSQLLVLKFASLGIFEHFGKGLCFFFCARKLNCSVW